ncbi:MAG: hypothetical protein IKJ35_01520 [Clostridia bacterium]|nr:hypothetical protein [Clostridia bacterium]
MIWNAVGNLIYLGCQWLVTVLVTNLGHFRDAGILSVAMSVSATFQTVAMFGIRNYQVSDVAGKYSDTTYVSFRVISCLAAMVGCIGFSLINAYRGEQLLAIFLFMVFRLAENFSDVLHGIAQKNERLDIAGKAFAIKGIGILATFLAGYRLSGNLTVGLLCMAAFSVLTTLVYDLFSVRRLSDFRLYQHNKSWLFLAKETLPLCAYLFLSSAMVTIPKLILEKQCGSELLGAYSSIFAPAMLIQAAMGYVYTPFAQIFGKHQQQKDRKSFLGLMLKVFVAILVLAVLMIIAAYFLGTPLLKILFGERILPYTSLLIPILLAIAVTSFFGFLCMIATVQRNFVFLLASCVVGFACCVLLTPPLLSASEANGASYSLILSTVLACLILAIGIFWTLLAKGKNKREE